MARETTAGQRSSKQRDRVVSRTAPKPLVDDPTLAELYEEWNREDPKFGPLLMRSRVGLLLAIYRRKAGKTQTALAGEMGTKQPAIARLESGRLDARFSTVDEYAAGVGLRVAFVDVKTGEQVDMHRFASSLQ